MCDRPPASWLFVPGHRPERFEKAVGVGADEIILDLEDAVAPDAKPAARESVVAWLSGGASGWVRINSVDSPWHDGDIEALSCCCGLRGVMVPKAEDPHVLGQIARRMAGGGLVKAQMVALVETARGLRNLDAICESRSVAALAFGALDLALDIDAHENDEALLYARSALVIASRAAGLRSPIDGVTVELHDPEVVAIAAARSRALGFGGKLCIHPSQVPVVNSAFAPSPTELEWAQRVLAAAEASGGSAFAVDGRMVDRPLLARAQRLLARTGKA